MKKLLRISILLILLLVFLFFTFNASPVLSGEDEVYLKAFIKEWNLPRSCDSCHRDFDHEVDFISRVQDSVIGDIRHEQVPFCNTGVVKFYYENRKGFCFDRAILLELFYKYYGFKVRHAFVYYHTDSSRTNDLDFLERKIYSHAMLEVKTSKGWMAVGTNHSWLGLDEHRNVLDLGTIRERLKQGQVSLLKDSQSGMPFFNTLPVHSNFKFIYGLYSRHGEFLTSQPVEKWMHKAGIPSFIPDYNIPALFDNF